MTFGKCNQECQQNSAGPCLHKIRKKIWETGFNGFPNYLPDTTEVKAWADAYQIRQSEFRGFSDCKNDMTQGAVDEYGVNPRPGTLWIRALSTIQFLF